MAKRATVPIDEVIASIPADDRTVPMAMHDNAVQIGYDPHITKSSKKDNFYKVEYKKPKVKDPLYILHVNGEKWSFRCKLFHLDQYVSLMNNLSEKALQGILASRPCKGLEGGCTVGIDFSVDGTAYLLCRHGMHFRELTGSDVQPVWELLRTESLYR